MTTIKSLSLFCRSTLVAWILPGCRYDDYIKPKLVLQINISGFDSHRVPYDDYKKPKLVLQINISGLDSHRVPL